MTSTGQFLIMRVSISTPEQKPLAVTVRCAACDHVTAAHGAQLTRSLDGVILICANCLQHQAVANDVLRQVGAMQLARWPDPTRPVAISEVGGV